MKKIILTAIIILSLPLLNGCGQNTTDTVNPPVSNGTAPSADILGATAPATDTNAQGDTVKKPQIPDEPATPQEESKKAIESEVKSILRDISKEENAAPKENTDTANQPSADAPAPAHDAPSADATQK
jgi:hypothetical protein